MGEIFYNKDGSTERIEIDRILKKGLDTITYKTRGNECLKVFRGPYGDEDLFQILSKINIDGLYRVNGLLYDGDGEFVAYRTKFYDKRDIDILTMPVDYTIENMKRLYRVSDVLGDNNIRIEDLHNQNVILTENGIIIIDADRYTYDPAINPNDYNKRFVNTVFTLLYMDSPSVRLLTKDYNYQDISNSMQQLLLRSNPEQVGKKLIRYKRPIDYIRKDLGK